MIVDVLNHGRLQVPFALIMDIIDLQNLSLRVRIACEEVMKYPSVFLSNTNDPLLMNNRRRIGGELHDHLPYDRFHL